MTDLKRQQFEGYMRTLKSYSLFRHGEGYVDADTQAKWKLWQVAWDAALTSQQPADDDWIEWGGDIGGLPPVGGSVVVEVRWSDGSVDSGEARQWRWSHEDESQNVIPNIIAYRVVKP